MIRIMSTSLRGASFPCTALILKNPREGLLHFLCKTLVPGFKAGLKTLVEIKLIENAIENSLIKWERLDLLDLALVAESQKLVENRDSECFLHFSGFLEIVFKLG